MLPLYIFLLAWLVFIGLYAIMSFLSVMQMVRFGVAGSGTWLATMGFLVGAFLIILGSGMYFLTVDWHLQLNIFGLFGGVAPSYLQ